MYSSRELDQLREERAKAEGVGEPCLSRPRKAAGVQACSGCCSLTAVRARPGGRGRVTSQVEEGGGVALWLAADARQKQAAKLRCPSNALRGRSPRDAANQKLMEELVQKTNRQGCCSSQ